MFDSSRRFKIVLLVGLLIGLATLILTEEEMIVNNTYSDHIRPAPHCIFETKVDLVISCMSTINIGTQVDKLVKVKVNCEENSRFRRKKYIYITLYLFIQYEQIKLDSKMKKKNRR